MPIDHDRRAAFERSDHIDCEEGDASFIDDFFVGPACSGLVFVGFRLELEVA